jgi:hypothetical protein
MIIDKMVQKYDEISKTLPSDITYSVRNDDIIYNIVFEVAVKRVRISVNDLYTEERYIYLPLIVFKSLYLQMRELFINTEINN